MSKKVDSYRANLIVFSFVILLLCTFNIVSIIVPLATKQLSVDNIMLSYQVGKTEAIVVLVITIAITAIVLLAQLYLGLKGLGIAKGTKKRTVLFVILCVVSLVFAVISLVFDAISFFKNIQHLNFDLVFGLVVSLLSVVFIYLFMSFARRVSNNN